jgi:hypothetical protein
VVQRSAEYEEDNDNESSPDLKGLDSREIYRVMPEFEWTKTEEAGGPCSDGHFWSPSLAYVTGYISKESKSSSSTIFVKIPLTVPYLEFLQEVVKHGELHPHNFGSAWKPLFGAKKGAKGRSALSIKNDGGTPTITFNKPMAALPKYLKDLMGAPERFDP